MKERKVYWIELFYDLIFVAAIASTNHWFLEIENEQDHFMQVLLKYVLMVIPMWQAWNSQMLFMNRFGEKKTKMTTVAMIVQVFFVIIMTASLNLNFDETYLSYIIGYIGIQFVIVLQYRYYYHQSNNNANKEIASLLSKITCTAILISASSLFFDGILRYFMLYLGVLFDVIVPMLKGKVLSKASLHLGHLTERTALLCMITFGEAIVSVVSILSGHVFEIKAFSYIVIVFLTLTIMWGSYFYQSETKGLTPNLQKVIYGNFFVIIAVMIFSATIKLGYDDIIEQRLINILIVGSYTIFLFAKNIIYKFNSPKKIKMIQREHLILGVLCLLGLIAVSLVWIKPVYAIMIVLVITIIDNLLAYRLNH